MEAAWLKGKKVLVVGLGVSGRSAAGALLALGADVAAADDSLGVLANRADVMALVEKGLHLCREKASGFKPDLVVVSPGVPLSHPLVAAAKEEGSEVIGEVELACRLLPCRMLGVTGTNGKTTVTLLAEHVLCQAGIDAAALGNTGEPLTAALDPSKKIGPETVLVVELSSFQLETLSTPCFDAAVLLNITPDHLDRYSSMEEYAAAKWRIGRSLKEGGCLYVEAACAASWRHPEALTYGFHPSCTIYTDSQHVFYGGKPQLQLPESLRGRRTHDVQNLMASYALCMEMGVGEELFAAAYSTFRKPPHRIEHICTKNGVAFVDDSKGTNLDAVIRAVASVEGGVVLIAGGVDKGAAYTPWIDAFAGKVRCICAIGQAAEKICAQLGGVIPTKVYRTLEEAVRAAAFEAKRGETVLLSPGCSSFDMFKDYAHRGDEFKRLVGAL